MVGRRARERAWLELEREVVELLALGGRQLDRVPRQLRQEGEANIQQTLGLLQQQDEKAIDLTINRQQSWLEPDNAHNEDFLLKLPLIKIQPSRQKSTFQAPVPVVKSIKSYPVSIPVPKAINKYLVSSSQAEVFQLKQVALKAANDAAARSAARHHWQWTLSTVKSSAALPDVTATVIRESNFG